MGLWTHIIVILLLQWQQSTDSGATWTDIRAQHAIVTHKLFLQADTFLFRLSGADASKIANSNCRVVSNSNKVEVDGIPLILKYQTTLRFAQALSYVYSRKRGNLYLDRPKWFFMMIFLFHTFQMWSLIDSGMYYAQIINTRWFVKQQIAHL
jgi:hypothetical protein